MKIKANNEIWFIKPGDIIILRSASSMITLEMAPGKKYMLEQYTNSNRAKEVYDEIWDAIKAGQDWYEMPEI